MDTGKHLCKKFSLTVGLFLLTAIISGLKSGNAYSADVVRPRPDLITIVGAIDAKSVKSMNLLMDKNVKFVAIASGGGDPKAAMEIGRILHGKGVALYVSNVCMGACAEYVFPAAAERFVAKDSLVAFAITATAEDSIVSNDADADVRLFFRNQRNDEVSYYKEIGVDTDILIRPTLAMWPRCYLVSRGAENEIENIAIKVSFVAGWVPDIQYMNMVGMKVNGTWVANADELGKLAQLRLKGGAGIAYGERRDAPVPRKITVIDHVGRCGDNDK